MSRPIESVGLDSARLEYAFDILATCSGCGGPVVLAVRFAHDGAGAIPGADLLTAAYEATEEPIGAERFGREFLAHLATLARFASGKCEVMAEHQDKTPECPLAGKDGTWR